MFKYFLLSGLIVFFTLFAPGVTGAYAGDQHVLAYVEGSPICISKLDRYIKMFFLPEDALDEWEVTAEFLRTSIRSEALQSMIENQLLLAHAEEKFAGNRRMNAYIQEHVDRTLSEMQDKLGSRVKLIRTIHDRGLTLNEWRQYQAEAIKIQSYVGEKFRGVNVRPAEIEDYYLRNKDDFKVQPQIYYRALYIAPGGRETRHETRARAEKIRTLLNEGHSFRDLARQYCVAYSEEKEGLVVEEVPGSNPDWRPGLVHGLSPGEISEVIESGRTFVIAKLEEVVPARIREFEEMQGWIHNKLYQKKMQERRAELVSAMIAKADIRLTEEGQKLAGEWDGIFLGN